MAASLAATLGVGRAAGQGATVAVPVVRTQSVDQAGTQATVAPGDVFRITVLRNPELSGEVAVGEDGTLQHPVYREVTAAGRTRPQLAALVRAVLLRYETNPQYVIEPLVRVSILGEVRTPGLLSVPTTTTLAQVVAMAGGPTERSRGRAVLMRDGRRVQVSLRDPSVGEAARPVQSRDQIVVERGKGISLTVITASAATLASLLIAFRATR